MRIISILLTSLVLISCNPLKDFVGGSTNLDEEFFSNQSKILSSLNNDLVSFYKFDYFSSGYVDSLNMNALSEFGTVTTPVVSGKYGNSLSCSSSNSTNYVANSSPINLDFNSSQDFSVSFWVKRLSQSASISYVFKINSGGGSIAAYQAAATDNLIFELGGHTAFKNSFFNDTDWKHVILRIDRDVGVSVCVNGVCDADDGFSLSDNFTSTTIFYICTNGTVNGLNGYVDSLGIWNRFLSDIEVNALYLNQTNLN